jgi:hypothetical protein
MRIYNPTCPFCKSDQTGLDLRSAAKVAWLFAAVVSLVATCLPIVKLRIKCEECGKQFLARGAKSLYSPHVGV